MELIPNEFPVHTRTFLHCCVAQRGCVCGAAGKPATTSQKEMGVDRIKKRNKIGYDMRLLKILVSLVAVLISTQSPLSAEPVAVTCTILEGAETASASLTNPLDHAASCMAKCKFSTAVYDDNPQIICAKPVPAGKQVEMCIVKAAGNPLLKVVEGIGDCSKL